MAKKLGSLRRLVSIGLTVGLILGQSFTALALTEQLATPDVATGHVRPGIQDMSEVLANHPLYLLVRWGYLDRAKGNKPACDCPLPPEDWGGGVSIDQGTMTVIKEALLNDGDKITNGVGDIAIPNKTVSIETMTPMFWSGMVLRIVPTAIANNTVTVKLNEFTKTYTVAELYAANDFAPIHDDFGHEVEVMSIHRLGFLAQMTRDLFFARKLKMLDHFLSVEKYLKGKIVTEGLDAAKIKAFHDLLEKFYLLTYTDNMAMKVDAAFKDWKAQMAGPNWTTDDMLKGLNILLADLNNSSLLNEKFVAGVSPFCDTDDSAWYADDVRFLKNNHMVSGDAHACTFRPGAGVTRAELLKMVIEAAGDSGDAAALSDDIATPFSDINGHWAHGYIAFAGHRGYVNGMNGRFYPNRTVTRAEAVKIILKAFGLNGTMNVGGFSDTSGHWAAGMITYAKNLGLVSGDPSGLFRPNDPLTRAEAAKIIRKAIEVIQIQK